MDLGIPFIKIGSGDIGNIPYLRYMGTKKMPVILSTGMSTLSDVEIGYLAMHIERVASDEQDEEYTVTVKNRPNHLQLRL